MPWRSASSRARPFSTVTGFDSFTLVLDTDGKQQVIYKHAISTIVPLRAISLQEEEG